MAGQRHKIPVHLETPDTLLLGMTARQSIIMGIALALAYIMISGVLRKPILLALAIVFAIVIFASAVLIGFVKVKHRNLDAWAVVLIAYWFTPRRYAWRPMPPEVVTSQPEAESRAAQASEEEDSD